MKRFLLFLSFFIYSVTSPCQQIPNGGFEHWDTLGIPDPLHWLYNYSGFCMPNPITAERTNDAHSGNWAAKVEAKFCYDESSVPQVYIGFLFVGDHPLYPDLGFGMYYSDRPDFLNFYYKFNKVGTDTAVAGILLREYDGSPFGTVIGEGKASIINDVNNYTFLSVPITYYSTATPGVLQVYFSTSKTVTDQSFYFLNVIPGNGANVGTTLWIDDVTVSGGTVGAPQIINVNNFQIFPNPTNRFLYFNIDHVQIEKIKIFDISGREIEKYPFELNTKLIIDLEQFANGAYYIKLQTTTGIYSFKIIKIP